MDEGDKLKKVCHKKWTVPVDGDVLAVLNFIYYIEYIHDLKSLAKPLKKHSIILKMCYKLQKCPIFYNIIYLA